MILEAIRLSNFQSFGEKPTKMSLRDITYLIGPNGSGKTAVLQALYRMFGFDPSLRRVRPSDFHVPHDETVVPEERHFWIEADFVFPELTEDEDNPAVPVFFSHMRLVTTKGLPRVRYRLSATMTADGDIEETLVYVLEIDTDDEPVESASVPKAERNQVHAHYLPARRDPAEHIAYGTNALLGRLLRSINWSAERDNVKQLTDQISESLAVNPAVSAFSENLKAVWSTLHKGSFFAGPMVTFIASEIESLLRHTSISFSPGHDTDTIDYSRLSDGQKSMLYLALVLSSQAIGQAVLEGREESFDRERLRPPVFTLVAIEEPENSLSPHYLGRIITALAKMTCAGNAQALIATHAPSMLKRVDPEHIRYLRLSENRTTCVTRIHLPEKTDDAHKFVREAVQAFPEVYFARLVVLGEGDSEEIVVPRILRAKNALVDGAAVTVAPLGGRHVNHFWRLLSGLGIPYLTLLDLDVARNQGGWGRIKYVNDQLKNYRPKEQLPDDSKIPEWDSRHKVRDCSHCLEKLEARDVYFSYPLDIDFAMLCSFPEIYGAEEETCTDSILNVTLGKHHGDATQYTEEECKLFDAYNTLFKRGSKPVAHIGALSGLKDEELIRHLPESLGRLADAIIARLAELPE